MKPLNKTMNQPPIRPVDAKAKKFIGELETLLKKYQYRIGLSLAYAPDGIKPQMRLINVPPEEPKKGKKRGS